MTVTTQWDYVMLDIDHSVDRKRAADAGEDGNSWMRYSADRTVEELRFLADQGYELVAVLVLDATDGSHRLFFKRPRNDEEP